MAESRQQVAGSSDVPLQQEAAAPWALIVNLAPGVAIAVDVTDRPGRLLGIVYGNLGQVLQITPNDALVPGNALQSASFMHVYDPVAGDWNRLREGANIGEALVDVSDRIGRLLGIIYGDVGQLLQRAVTRDLLVQLRSAGIEIDPRDRNWNLGALDVPDLSDRWARLLGQVDLARVLGAALSAANPVIAGIFDAAGNRMPSMDIAARAGFVDVIDRAARLAGIVYGNQAQLQQVPGTLELITQDTGLNTNPERWLHDNHWDCNEVTIAAIGVGGQQNLGAAVAAGDTRRIREITIRHAGTNNTVVTILIAGGATKLTIDVPAQTTRVWSSQDGLEFLATVQPAAQTSDVTGGSTYVSARGVEV